MHFNPLPLKATDKDLGMNSKLRYSILTGNTKGYFTVDSSNGQLSTTQALDYETDQIFTLLVHVYDLDGNTSYGESFHDNAVVYISVKVFNGCTVQDNYWPNLSLNYQQKIVFFIFNILGC